METEIYKKCVLLYMSVKYNLQNLNATSHIYFNPNTEKPLDEIKTIIEMDEHFILPNENDANDTYQNLAKYIGRLIEYSNVLCKGLNPSYIKDAFEDADAVIAISSAGINILPNGNIFGFALVHFNEDDNSVYIDIICSHTGIKYAGDILLNSINYMCNILLITKIKLNSVSLAISFYEKYGFHKKGACDNDEDLCEMEKIVPKRSLGGKHKLRRTSKGKKNKQTKQMKNHLHKKTRSVRK